VFFNLVKDLEFYVCRVMSLGCKFLSCIYDHVFVSAEIC